MSGQRLKTVGYCSIHQKQQWKSETDAEVAMRTMKKEGGNRRERRAYLCPFCHFWHLTSTRDWEEGGIS